MSRLALHIAVSASLLFGLAPRASAEAVLAPVNAFKLPDALHAYTLEDRQSPWVAVDTWVEAGSAADFPGYPGLAHAVANAVWLAGDRPLFQAIAELGGNSEVIVTRDTTRFVVNLPADRLGAGLLAIGTAMARPNWGALNLSALQGRMRTRAQAVADDPAASAIERFMAAAFGPEYGHPVEGDPDAVAAFGLAELQAYHHRHYVPAQVKVFLVGDFAAGRAAGQLMNGYSPFFKRFALNSAPPVRPLAPRAEARAPRPEAQLVLGLRGPGCESMRELATMDVLTALLGGQHGRLTERLVTPGTARKLEVSWRPQRRGGAFVVTATAEPAAAATIEKAVRDEFAELRAESISLLEHSLALEGAEKAFEERNRTLAGRAGTLGAFAVYAGDYRLARQYGAEIRQVTRNNVLELAQRYMTADALKVVVQ